MGEAVVLVEFRQVVFQQSKYVLAARRTMSIRVNPVGVFHDFFLYGRERQSPPSAAALRRPVLCNSSELRSFNDASTTDIRHYHCGSTGRVVQ